MPSPKTISKEVTGFIYKGKRSEVTLGEYKVRLVPNETYIIPHLEDPQDIHVTLKREGAELKIPVTGFDYYKHLSSGRLTFSDPDPYL